MASAVTSQEFHQNLEKVPWGPSRRRQILDKVEGMTMLSDDIRYYRRITLSPNPPTDHPSQEDLFKSRLAIFGGLFVFLLCIFLIYLILTYYPPTCILPKHLN